MRRGSAMEQLFSGLDLIVHYLTLATTGTTELAGVFRPARVRSPMISLFIC